LKRLVKLAVSRDSNKKQPDGTPYCKSLQQESIPLTSYLAGPFLEQTLTSALLSVRLRIKKAG